MFFLSQQWKYYRGLNDSSDLTMATREITYNWYTQHKLFPLDCMSDIAKIGSV